MVVLLILVLSCLIFRGIGFVGVTAFATWQASARDALSLILFFTGVSHFSFMKDDLVRMMPPSIPWPRAMVYFTGVCEIAGAVGLLPRRRLCINCFFLGGFARQYSRRAARKSKPSD